MDGSEDALFSQRYLDEFDNRVSELHKCVELARVHAARTMHQTVMLYLDAADAHEQAAEAYQLAGSNGHITDFQARAMQHRQAAAARRAAAAAMASRLQERHDSDHLGPRAAISDGERLSLPGPPRAGSGQIWVPCGECPHRQQHRKVYEQIPPDHIEHQAIGPWQTVLPLAGRLRLPS